MNTRGTHGSGSGSRPKRNSRDGLDDFSGCSAATHNFAALANSLGVQAETEEEETLEEAFARNARGITKGPPSASYVDRMFAIVLGAQLGSVNIAFQRNSHSSDTASTGSSEIILAGSDRVAPAVPPRTPMSESDSEHDPEEENQEEVVELVPVDLNITEDGPGIVASFLHLSVGASEEEIEVGVAAFEAANGDIEQQRLTVKELINKYEKHVGTTEPEVQKSERLGRKVGPRVLKVQGWITHAKEAETKEDSPSIRLIKQRGLVHKGLQKYKVTRG